MNSERDRESFISELAASGEVGYAGTMEEPFPESSAEIWSRKIRQGWFWKAGVPLLGATGILGLLILAGVHSKLMLGIGSFVGVVLSFIVCDSIYRRIHRIAEKHQAEDKDLRARDGERRHQEAEGRRQEQEAKRHEKEEARRRELDASLGEILALGFEKRDLIPVLANLSDPQFRASPEGERLTFPQLLARHLFQSEGSQSALLVRLMKNWSEGNRDCYELFSFGLSTGLLKIDSEWGQELFRQELTEALHHWAAKGLGSESQLALQQDLPKAVKMEVWFFDGLPNETAMFAHKPALQVDGMVHYLMGAPHPDSNEKPFQLWELQPSLAWRSRAAPHLHFPENGRFVYSPPIKGMHSAMVDFESDQVKQGGFVEIDRLAVDRALRDELGVRLVKESSPYPMSSIALTDRKGYIRLCGWWEEGEWHEVEESPETETLLTVAAPNILIQPGQFAITVDDDEENRIIASYLAAQAPQRLVEGAISSRGNFVIRRGPIAEACQIHKYFIQPIEGAAPTTLFYRKAPGESEAHRDLIGYREFPESEDPSSPLEREGYRSFPFSDCYLASGTDSYRLCFYISLGSPAPGDTNHGIRYQDQDLIDALERFGRRQGAAEFEVLDKWRSQGLIAHANLDRNGRAQSHFLKLLEPPLARRFGTTSMVKKLIAERVLPTTVEIHQVNTDGQPGANAMIPIFVSPEFSNTADAVSALTPDAHHSELGHLANELVVFAKRVLDLGIVCTDFTLADTFFDNETVAAFLRESSSSQVPENPRLFVGDYGSYVKAKDLTKTNRIIKEEYRPPEDWDADLPIEAEAYQIYVLGVLFVEVLSAQPATTLKVVTRLQLDRKRQAYEEELPKELEQLLSRFYSREVLQCLERMLAYDPVDRPKLMEILST